MNNIKNVFTIKDLENLTGIKAHTIRIWEKRYNILQPLRTETNIRIYDVQSLQKLLNIKTLNSFGYKISNIAKLTEEEIPQLVRRIQNEKNVGSRTVSNFKLAMMNFDQHLFYNTYNTLLESKSFTEIFYECFIPLLEEIGNLWQTNTITPAHEHFISALIKQKIAINTEKLMANPPQNDSSVHVLYLPDGEIHEIGLMFINYELLRKGYRTIYIGESVPIECLVDIKNYFEGITFVTYITIDPPSETESYINLLKKDVLNDKSTSLVILGKNSEMISPDYLNDNIHIYRTVSSYMENIIANV